MIITHLNELHGPCSLDGNVNRMEGAGVSRN